MLRVGTLFLVYFHILFSSISIGIPFAGNARDSVESVEKFNASREVSRMKTQFDRFDA